MAMGMKENKEKKENKAGPLKGQNKQKLPEAAPKPEETKAEESAQEEEQVLSLDLTLGRAAEKHLRRVSEEMAKSLGDKAAQGDAASSKLLLQLAEKGREVAAESNNAEARAALDAMINEWAHGPEWTGPKEGEEYLKLCDEKLIRQAKRESAYESPLIEGAGEMKFDEFKGFL